MKRPTRRTTLCFVIAGLISFVQAADAPASRIEEIAVVVIGAVNKPGECKLKRGSVVSDAIAAAGGLTRTGRLEIIHLSRPEANGEWSRHRLNLSKSGPPSDNMLLRDGDRIYAPEPFL